MTTTVTVRDSKTVELSPTVAIQSNSHTPANGSKVFVAVSIINQSSLLTGSLSITDSLVSHLSWHKDFYVLDNEDTYNEIIAVWSADVVTGAPMTVTVSSSDSANDNHLNIHIWDVVSGDGAIAVSPTNFITAHAVGSGAFSVNLPSAPAATSLKFGLRSRCCNGSEQSPALPGSGWTEIADTHPDGYTALESEFFPVGSTSQAIAWTDVHDNATDSGVFTSNALGFEVTIGSGGGGGTAVSLIDGLTASRLINRY